MTVTDIIIIAVILVLLALLVREWRGYKEGDPDINGIMRINRVRLGEDAWIETKDGSGRIRLSVRSRVCGEWKKGDVVLLEHGGVITKHYVSSMGSNKGTPTRSVVVDIIQRR